MNIYESIAAVQSDIDFIGKDKVTQSGNKFKYRGVDQVLNTLHPLFARHKVFTVPEVLELLVREERATNTGGTVLYEVLKVKYTFYAEDGTSVAATVVGEAMDSGDKVSNKCMSVAYKHACFQLLSIPTEETCVDPDDNNEELKPKNGAAQNRQTDKRGQVTDRNKLGGKTNYKIIEDIIRGTAFTMDDVDEYIEGTYGNKIALNDLSAEQFKKVISTLQKGIARMQEGGNE